MYNSTFFLSSSKYLKVEIIAKIESLKLWKSLEIKGIKRIVKGWSIKDLGVKSFSPHPPVYGRSIPAAWEGGELLP